MYLEYSSMYLEYCPMYLELYCYMYSVKYNILEYYSMQCILFI